jgi:DNA repair protein RadC
MESHDFRPIRSWNEDDRPREKLSQKGPSSLSDAELLAILIGSGTRQYSALDLARMVLHRANNNLVELSKIPSYQLREIRGIGEARSVIITAALELGRRRQGADAVARPMIKSSNDLYRQMDYRISHLSHEEFWVASINQSNRLIGCRKISSGGITSTIADVRIMLRYALEMNATSIALFHNHPSGNLKPSDADLRLTKNIVQAATWMDIRVLDHIIIGDSGYFSFADQQLL